ncbi:mannose-6-phosphate isomerase-like protein (cupin superfamily) [Haloactinomyces albus]|uniref:Mannose-6-phosphate isomerase-like protein (Cupin superfamily) n=2 Tax=Haloactinomyces albus TaxID=1352928 RepID=A0AAE4CPZ2_9ACTN|nr:cupin domain-containing protein [Haloactinomyces albus]MDR7303567.1 mannose-6-phosphate isomerase-like protein (cupin superfamily) [Haloactinomyces albus]
MDADQITLGPLPEGITLAGEGMNSKVWNVLGHTYYMKSSSESSFAFETVDPPGTGVPPHVHTTQDEHIYVLEGVFTLYLDGQWETAGPGDTVRMPMGLPHAYYNRSEDFCRALFWVSPAGRLAELFDQLHNLEDPEEVVRRSALRDVDFLPAGSVAGA